MQKVICIVGPTGVGKTKLSIELAKKLNGEIINADSTQVYKGMDIATAKVTEEEKEGIVHHLFDIKEIEEIYTVFDYQKDCRLKIKEIEEKGKMPILVGGTGLYIKSALYDYKLDYHNNTNTYDNLTTEELYQKLISIDKEIEGHIDKNNKRRLINAISYYENNHTSIIHNKTNKLLYDVIFIGLTTTRDNLYNIINNRVDKMVQEGLVEEVSTFHKEKIYTKPLTGGIGYKELYEYLDNKVSLEVAIDNIKRNSRRYAKKQYTFFNHQLPIKWFETNYNNFSNTIKEICKYIDSIK